MNLEAIIESTGAFSCFACGKCTSRCPLAQTSAELGREDVQSPRALISQALTGALDENSDFIWSCLTCNACAVKCPSNVAFPEFVRGLRTEMKKDGRAKETVLCSGGRQLNAAGQLMATKDLRQKRMGWAEGLDVAKEGDTLFFVGCAPYIDLIFRDMVHTVEIAKNMVRIMNHCGIKPVVMDQEVCCGHDQLWTGEEDTFLKLAEKNIAMIKATGAKKIVATCPECYRTIKVDYKKHFDFEIEVQHSTEFISEQMKAGTVHFRRELPEVNVSYQDPCRLGKHMGVFDEPRRVLNGIPGVFLIEIPQTRTESACCGTSAWTGCDKVREDIRIGRMAQSQETLVTACPKCMVHFSCTQQRNTTIGPALKDIRIKDITQLVAEGLESEQ